MEAERPLDDARLSGSSRSRRDSAWALERYLSLVESGRDSEAQEFLKVHPELRKELQTLDALDALVEDRSLPRRFGGYQIIRELGRGGMGIVYEARDLALGRTVALKVIPAAIAGDDKLRERFRREAQLTARLDHPNIVKVFTAGLHDKIPYIVMEYVDGQTLQEILLEQKSPRNGARPPAVLTGPSWASTHILAALAGGFTDPKRRASDNGAGGEAAPATAHGTAPVPGDYRALAKLFAGAAEGLQAAHSLGIVHRDIKPSNLILDSRGLLRILDFGLARAEDSIHLTGPQERLGTPLYMSPEQARGGNEQVGPPSDIYSLGTTLYEVLAGRPPFLGSSHREVTDKLLHADPPLLRRINPEVPRDLSAIVYKCMRKKPGERYATAEALAQDLDRFSRGEAVEAKPPHWTELLARKVWRGRRRAVEVALLLGVLLGGVFFVKERWNSQREELLSAYRSEVRRGVLDIARYLAMAPGIERVQGREVEAVVAEDASMRYRETNLFDVRQSDVALLTRLTTFSDLRRERLAEATAALQYAVSIYAGDPSGHYHLARALALHGRFHEARQSAQQALAAEPGFVPALNLLVWLAERSGEIDASGFQEQLEQAAGASWPPAWLEAQRAVFAHRWQSAAQAFRRLAGLAAPGRTAYIGADVDTQLLKCIALLKSGDPAALRRMGVEVGAAAQILEHHPEPYLLWARAQYMLGESAAAQGILEETYKTFARAQPHRSKETALQCAVLAAEVGDYETAERWAQKAGEIPQALFLRTECLCRLGRFDAALALAAEARKLSPMRPEPLLATADVFTAQGRTHEAAKWYARTIAQFPNDPRGYVGLSNLLLDLGENRSAFILLLTAAQSPTPYWPAHYQLGRFHTLQGDLPRALRRFRDVIRIDPSNAMAFNSMGTVLDRLGYAAEAQDAYRRAIELAPTLGPAHYNLAWSYHRNRNHPDAARHYRRALECGLESYAVVYENLGACLHHMLRYDDAIRCYQRAIALSPQSALAHYDLACAYAQKAKSIARFPRSEFAAGTRRVLLESAERHLERSAALSPREQVYFATHGYILEKLGRSAEAKERYSRALELDPLASDARMGLVRLAMTGSIPIPETEEASRWIGWLEPGEAPQASSCEVSALLGELRHRVVPFVPTYRSADAAIDAPVTLVGPRSEWRFFRGHASPGSDLQWALPDFDDAAWEPVELPLGYGSDPLLRTTLSEMRGSYSSAYLRATFEVGRPEALGELVLRVRADDGFVAYLNGREIARHLAGRRRGVPVPFDATAEDDEFWPWRFWKCPIPPSLLRRGANVLALHVLNSAPDDADFLIDARLTAGLPQDTERWRRARRLADALGALVTPEGNELLEEIRRYVRARRLELEGWMNEALSLYLYCARERPEAPEPILRAAECLLAMRKPQKAFELLDRALSGPAGGRPELWEAWARLGLTAAGRDARDLLDRVGLDRAASAGRRPPEAVRALLEALAAPDGIRINAGGARHTHGDRAWSADCGYLAGYPLLLPLLMEWGRELPDAAVYRCERYFPEPSAAIHAYSLPLRTGTYLVRLHFAEGYHSSRGKRAFDIHIEGVPRALGYEPPPVKNGVAPDVLEFSVDVHDGSLDIHFVPRIDFPKISGLEVVPLH